MPKFISLRTKISFLLLLFIIVLTLGIGGTLYFEFQKIFRGQLVEDLDQVMNQNRLAVDQMIDSIDQATMLMYNDNAMIEILNRSGSDHLTVTRNKAFIQDQMIKYIYVPLNNKLTPYQLAFFIDDGIPFASVLSTAKLEFNGIFNNKEIASEAWYLDTVKMDGLVHWFVNSDIPDNFYVTRLIKNLPVYEEYTGQEKSRLRNLGVVVIQFNIKQMMSKIESSKLTPNTEIVLFDSAGNMLSRAHEGNGPEDDEFKTIYQTHMRNGDRPDTFTLEGKRYTYTLHELSNGWQLAALIPSADITAQLSAVRRIIVTTMLIALFTGVAISVFISAKISRPIRKLVEVMRGVNSPSTISMAPLESPGNDEVGMLYHSYNIMMTRINGLIRDVYDIGVKEKESELKALQAQINPHFLYNTLDSVNWMALGMGAESIAKVISSLANMLRYAIKDPNKQVYVSEEIEQVKQYLTIQLECYSQGFDVVYDIDPMTLIQKSPKLLLQPLVENAIQHGFEQAGGTGTIMIRSAIQNECLELSVSNTGNRASAGELNEYLSGKDVFSKNTPGYGVRNVDHRIKLLFGSSYGLRYEDGYGGELKAVIRLPKTTT